ncbi:hypothetical protein [Salinimicrobium sp. HB62]|uniref:hypothetical protein n=1 Tax=Salinimicrobium sp. HB62 TaxID=3077781 RepID=UPI002D78DF6C|nr:hypothetical protein [Salinimicrobium sp. HB62]
MKKLLLLISFIFLNISAAQSQERVEVTGTIIVPAGHSPGSIHVYNKSTGKGSVSDSGGNFEIRVIEGDSIYFSALQFKEQLVVVDAEVEKRGRLVVEILVGVNELPEVVIRPHDLSGDLEIDAENIETQDLFLPTMTAFSINDYDWEWRADAQTGVVNAAMPSSTGMKNGANLKALFGEAISLLLPPKKVKSPAPSQRNNIGLIKLEREIRSRYDEIFFKDVLNISTESISDFIEFLDSKGFSADLLEKERELELIELLILRSREFAEV